MNATRQPRGGSGAETNADWAVATDFGGHVRRFGAETLPISIGGAVVDDIAIEGVQGSIRIGVLDGVFFVDPGRGTRNLRVNGASVTATRKLAAGDVIALDSARLYCAIAGGTLTLGIEARVTAGDTAPPDLDELARAASAVDEFEIKPIAFRPDTQRAEGRKSRVPRPATLAAAAGFAVLAVLAWFAFTAKSVEFQFEPQAAEYSLPGTFLKLWLRDRVLLSAGKHRIAAQLPGYYPLNTEIDVGADRYQTLKLSFTKLPGKISLTAEPDVQASVSVDGQPLGRTPMTADIRPGKHRFEFSADRYLSEVRELDVTGGGEAQALNVAMTPSWAPVSLATDPPGAAVFVDGQAAGTTPAKLEIDAGTHELEARLPGYNAWQTTIAVAANQPQELPPVKLVQADGRIDLATKPESASVTVDGKFLGRTPVTLRLRPGRNHELTIAKPGYETVTRTLSIEADSGRKLAIDLVALYGDVEIDSAPQGAEVWVDGSRRAATPAKLELTAVEHRIEVRREGFASKNAEVTPRPGFAQTLRFELAALDQGSGSGYAQTIKTGLGQELKLIPAGEFTMGSPRSEPGRRSNEVQRPVKLSRAFYLGAREVTNAEFRAYQAEHDSGSFSGKTLNDDAQPVVRVKWEDAAQFLNWLSVKDGLQPVYEPHDGTWVPARPLRNGYRLPTEAEWEWAARFAKRDKPLVYPWGDELPAPDRSDNFADVSAADVLQSATLAVYSDGFPVAAPVGSFPADALGLYDIGGNVAEWVQDYYEITFEADVSGKPAVDPLGPADGRFHVIRGSSWRSYTKTDLRLAYRDYSGDAREDLGFRIARNLE
ncbi:MAG TPA: PEGA domain-containing protein [Gammaproteobacteria bacterium]|nr:PEGA domain-containing protein [Gammaproteobacteria bacterium]